jgi:hypothetical protein
LFALRELNYMFINSFCPVFITGRLMTIKYPEPYVPDAVTSMCMDTILAFSILTMMTSFFLIFVSYKKGFRLWREMAPYLYICMICTCYLVQPILSLAASLSTYIYAKNNDTLDYCYLFPWLISYSVFSLGSFFTYFLKF